MSEFIEMQSKVKSILKSDSGHFEHNGNLYSLTGIEMQSKVKSILKSGSGRFEHNGNLYSLTDISVLEGDSTIPDSDKQIKVALLENSEYSSSAKIELISFSDGTCPRARIEAVHSDVIDTVEHPESDWDKLFDLHIPGISSATIVLVLNCMKLI